MVFYRFCDTKYDQDFLKMLNVNRLIYLIECYLGTKCTCFQEDKVSAILICCGISTANAASVALLLRLRNLLPQTSLLLQLQLTFGK